MASSRSACSRAVASRASSDPESARMGGVRVARREESTSPLMSSGRRSCARSQTTTPPPSSSRSTHDSAGVGRLEDIVGNAWDLDAVAQTYDQFIARFERLRPKTPEAVFQAQTHLVHGWRKFPSWTRVCRKRCSRAVGHARGPINCLKRSTKRGTPLLGTISCRSTASPSRYELVGYGRRNRRGFAPAANDPAAGCSAPKAA